MNELWNQEHPIIRDAKSRKDFEPSRKISKMVLTGNFKHKNLQRVFNNTRDKDIFKAYDNKGWIMEKEKEKENEVVENVVRDSDDLRNYVNRRLSKRIEGINEKEIQINEGGRSIVIDLSRNGDIDEEPEGSSEDIDRKEIVEESEYTSYANSPIERYDRLLRQEKPFKTFQLVVNHAGPKKERLYSAVGQGRKPTGPSEEGNIRLETKTTESRIYEDRMAETSPDETCMPSLFKNEPELKQPVRAKSAMRFRKR